MSLTGLEKSRKSFSKRLKALLEYAEDLPNVGLLVRAATNGQKNLAKDMSASIAYFTFLSLFPLILGLFAIGANFLKSDEAQARITQSLTRVLPQSLEFVTGNMETLIRHRGAVGFASAIVLMWSASKMVSAITRGVNNALGQKRSFNYLVSRLRSFGLTLSVALLVFATVALAPLLELLDNTRFDFIASPWSSIIGVVSGTVAGVMVSALLVGLIYWLVPYKRIRLPHLMPGIVVAAIAIELGKQLFAYYVGNLSRFDAVYGSVSSVIVLLIWLYFMARVLLYGAEVIAVYRAHRIEREATRDLD